MIRSLQELLDYPGEDIEETFCLNFTVRVSSFTHDCGCLSSCLQVVTNISFSPNQIINSGNSLNQIILVKVSEVQ